MTLGQSQPGDEEILGSGTDENITRQALQKLEAEKAEISVEEYERRKKAILRDTDSEGVGLSFEVHAGNIPEDSETIRKGAVDQIQENITAATETLDNLNWDQNLEALSEEEKALLTHLVQRLITEAHNQKYNSDSLATLPDPTPIFTTRAKLGSTEVKALKLFREKSRTILGADLDKLAEDAAKAAPVSAEVANPDENAEPWVKKTAKKVLGYAVDHPWKTAALVTVGALGVYGLYKLVPRFIKGLFEDNKDKLGWKMDMATNGTGIFTIGGILIGAGMLLGPEHWRTWIREKLGINLSLETIGKCIKEQSLDPFFDQVVKTNKNDRLIADYLDVSSEKIAMLRDVKMKDFQSVTSSWVNFLEGAGYEFADNLGINLNVPFLHDQDERMRAVEATEALQELFARPDVKVLLARKKPKTVGEALDDLVAANFFGKSKGGEGPTVAPSGIEDEANKPPYYDENSNQPLGAQLEDVELFGEGEGQIGISEDSWKWLEKRIGTDSKTHEVISEFESVWDWMKPNNFIEFAEALYQDGYGMVVNRKGLFIVDGAEMIFLSNWGGLVDTAKTSLEAMVFEDTTYKDALITYVDEELGFMILFGAPTILSGIWSMARGNWKGGAGEVLRGTAKGAAGPVLFAWWQGEKMADAKRWVEEGIRYKWRTNLDEPAKARLQMRQLKYYTEMFEMFDRRYQSAVVDTGLIPTSKEVSIPRHLARKGLGLLRRERLEAQRMHYARRVIQTHNALREAKAFQKQFGIENPAKRIDPDIIDFDELYEVIDQNKEAVRSAELKDAKPEIDRISSDYRQRWQTKDAIIRKGIKGEPFTRQQAETMLAERGIDPKSPEANTFMEKWIETVTEEEVLNGKFKPNIEPVGENIPGKPRIQLLKEGPKSNTYRYMGTDIKIPKDVCDTFPSAEKSLFEHLQKARQECSTRWQVHGRRAIVENMRVLEYSDERATFQVGDERVVIERIDSPEAMERAAIRRFLEFEATENSSLQIAKKSTTDTHTTFEINGKEVTVEKSPNARQNAIEKFYTDKLTVKVNYEQGTATVNGKKFTIEKWNSGEFVEAATRRYTELYEQQGKTPPPGLRKAIARSVSWVPELEAVLGVAGTAWVFYEALGSGKSDKEAAVEIVSAVVSAFGTVKVYEMTAGKHIENPYLHLLGVVLAGIVGVMGFQDDFEWILEKAFDKIPGLEVEGAHIITQHMMVRSAINWGIRPALRTIPRLAANPLVREAAPRIAARLGLKTFGEKLGQTVIAQFGRRVGTFIEEKLLISILKVAPKAAGGSILTGLLIADDATLIGILDDGLAVAMWAWTAHDVICLIKLARKAFAYKDEMEKREETEIESIEIIEQADKDRIASRLRTDYSLTNEEIFNEYGNINPTLYQQGEYGELIMADIMQNGHFFIKRVGISGGEEYLMQNGEAKTVTIYGSGNNYETRADEIVSIELAELEEAEEAAEKMEKGEEDEEQETPDEESNNEDNPYALPKVK